MQIKSANYMPGREVIRVVMLGKSDVPEVFVPDDKRLPARQQLAKWVAAGNAIGPESDRASIYIEEPDGTWTEDTAAMDARDAAAQEETSRDGAYDVDAVRKAFVDAAKQGPGALETFLRDYINADAVTDLGTARAFAKRSETAIVQLAKALATVVLK